MSAALAMSSKARPQLLPSNRFEIPAKLFRVRRGQASWSALCFRAQDCRTCLASSSWAIFATSTNDGFRKPSTISRSVVARSSTDGILQAQTIVHAIAELVVDVADPPHGAGPILDG